MPKTTLPLHVRVVTYDPAGDALVPVPGATVVCKNSHWLRDGTLSTATPATDSDGRAALTVEFEEAERDGLNPYFVITIPEASRRVPAAAPAPLQVQLPGSWTTPHAASRRVQDTGAYPDAAHALELRVGVTARVKMSYADFHPTQKRNPLALPVDAMRVALFDQDWFLFDAWNPDDDVPALVFDPRANQTITSSNERIPFFDQRPHVPFAWEDPAPPYPTAVIDPPGSPLGRIGGGSFTTPGVMATDVHGFVFVADGARILRFHPDGTLAETITRAAPGFSDIRGLAVDQYRNLYVAEAGANRVSVWTLRGAVQALVTPSAGRYAFALDQLAGSGPNLSSPRGLAVVHRREADAPEVLAVADHGNSRVQLYTLTVPTPARLSVPATPALVPLAAFGAPGAPLAPGAAVPARTLAEPVGIAADRRGRIYVADARAHRVSRWDGNAARTAWAHGADWEKAGGGSGAGAREFNAPGALAADLKNDFLYVADSGNNRIQRLELADAGNGSHLADWVPIAGYQAAGLACDTRGELYASDTTAKRVHRGSPYDAAGAPLGTAAAPRLLGSWKDAADASMFSSPGYVAFAPDGKLWVSDAGNKRAQAFRRDAAGDYAIFGNAAADALLGAPAGLTWDGDNNLWIVDSANHKVHRFDATPARQAEIGAAGAANNQLNDPRGIAIVQLVEPFLYIADRGNNRVTVLKRDGTAATPPLTVVGGTNLLNPEDVAADAAGNVYVADTGNRRILRFTRTAGVLDAGAVLATPALSAPCGISVDSDGNLLVTDRAAGSVFHLSPTGALLASWDLRSLVPHSASSGAMFFPELARLILFDQPSRALLTPGGVLLVADTGHHCVRLVRVRTELKGNLLNLPEDEPELYVSCRAEANPAALGLKLDARSVVSYWFDSEPHTVEYGHVEDFAREEYVPPARVVDSRAGNNAAVNAMRAAGTAWRWLTHLTRHDDAAWRVDAARDLTLSVDLTDEAGSLRPWDADAIKMASVDPAGGGPDAWDDSVVVHELSHWLMEKSIVPLIPFKRQGGPHTNSDIIHPSIAASEGYAEYHQLFWGTQFGNTDRLRGFALTGQDSVTTLRDRSTNLRQHVYGSPPFPFGGNAAPTWATPGAGRSSEGYFANTLYQLHHALVDPEVLFADHPQFWHWFNSRVGDTAATRYADLMRRPMRMFPHNPTDDQFNNGTREWLKQILRKAHDHGAPAVEVVRALFELNDALMPSISVALSTAPSAELGASVDVPVTANRRLLVTLKDAAGFAMAGRNLTIVLANPANFTPFAGPSPAVVAGVVLAAPPANTFQRATDASGQVELVYTAPIIAGPETVTIAYQPDFDTDASLAPPARGDDLETARRKLFLYELRAANKVWAGVGQNLGSIVQHVLTLNVVP